MKIDTALILCAGYGKRLNPITLETPKPLLKINNLTLLENCIQLIINLKIKKILINTFYLKSKFQEFLKTHDYNIEIEVIEDGKFILNTGGGILNLIKNSKDQNFLVLNPDTIWNKKYIDEINSMINFYFLNNLDNILLLVKKNLSFDKNMEGDFGLKNNLINLKNKEYLFTGCQILNRSIMKNELIKNFSINKIWFELLKKYKLYGFESKNNFYHLSNLEVFKKLKDL